LVSDHEREYFLGLDRQWIGYEKGYWATFRVSEVETSEERPHGFQYSLSLHDANDDRVLGYNNAHGVDVGSGPSRKSGRPKAFDHINRRGRKPVPYQFKSPYELVSDFLGEVERILKKEGAL
jgi:hypothetical protein